MIKPSAKYMLLSAACPSLSRLTIDGMLPLRCPVFAFPAVGRHHVQQCNSRPGRHVMGHFAVFRYVQQDDVLPGTSSVWEYLSFHARLRLPADSGRGRREAQVWRVIKQLGLTKVRVRHRSHQRWGSSLVTAARAGTTFMHPWPPALDNCVSGMPEVLALSTVCRR